MQDAKAHKIMNMKASMGVPIQLSIVLDSYNAAIGNVFMEPTFGDEYQYLTIKMVNNMLMFQSEQNLKAGGILE